MGSINNSPYEVVLEVDGRTLETEVDTGASVSLISHATQKALYPRAILGKPKLRVFIYTAPNHSGRHHGSQSEV